MGLLKGKRGIIMGIANEYSIATSIAKAFHSEGAAIGYSHLPDKDGRDRAARKIQTVTSALDPVFISPCDVSDDASLEAFFQEVQAKMGTIDFLIHAIAFAPIEDIRRATIGVSRDGFKTAMDISVYSFLTTTNRAAGLMNDGGSVVTLSYFGGEKVIAGYNLMGLCKAALESATTYAAYDLGPKNIRVNAISAGPIKTLAASAIGDFKSMLRFNAAMSPLGKNVTGEDVAKSALYLCSDLSTGTTGEVLHVDSGYHVMGSPGYAFERLGIELPK